MPSSINYTLRLQGKQAREVTVWLAKEDHTSEFWCNYCRKGLFSHEQRVIAIIGGCTDGVPFLTPPVSVQCSNCGTIYHIRGIIE